MLARGLLFLALFVDPRFVERIAQAFLWGVVVVAVERAVLCRGIVCCGRVCVMCDACVRKRVCRERQDACIFRLNVIEGSF